MVKVQKQELSEKEIARRRDQAIERALNTPPKTQKDYVSKGKKPIAKKSKSSFRHQGR